MSISSMALRTSRRGFTIVELLIVIVVIAILAAITIVSYSGIQRQAQVSSAVDGLSKVRTGFNMWMIDEGRNGWPEEPTYGGGTNLSNMIADNAGLKKYLQTVPSVVGIGTQEWFYDNDVIEEGGHGVCSNMYNGVNIVIRYITDESLAEAIDKALDKENVPNQNWDGCGRVKYDKSAHILFYSISYNKTDSPY